MSEEEAKNLARLAVNRLRIAREALEAGLNSPSDTALRAVVTGVISFLQSKEEAQ